MIIKTTTLRLTENDLKLITKALKGLNLKGYSELNLLSRATRTLRDMPAV